ncbi:hypothetical protein JTB14_013580 [Gonioctena quinquepunctata]|nr:hypothetical protein JTB14_013580 [Gonioctena quinquepunctata]
MKISPTTKQKKVIVNTPKPNISYAQASSSPAAPSTQDIIKELLPLLIDALKSHLPPLTFTPPYPMRLSRPTDGHSEGSFSRPTSQMSKRGRSDSSDLDSITSETYPNSQSGTKKKTKKGWPKGKPRKHFSTPQTDTEFPDPTLTDGPQQSSQQPRDIS